MSFKWKIIKNQFPSMESAVKAIDGKKINVGVKGEHAWLASIHEYGCTIQITPKMRAWLHRNGFHVKDSTTQIVIPERSFLRSGFDECHLDAIEQGERILPLVLEGKLSETQLYELVGGALRDGIQDYAEDMSSPSKHPFTLERNGGKSDLLTDTGDMINSIDFEVE